VGRVSVRAPSYAVRRHLLTGVTLLVLIGLVGLGAYYGYKALFSPVGDSVTASTDECDDGLRRGETVRTRDVTVSVFNAGSRAGLAARVQEQLVGRGFLAGTTDNAPDGTGVRFVRVLAPSRQDPAARLVAVQFGDRTAIQRTRDDLGPGVEVIVGDRYGGLERGAPRRLRATTAGSGC
jgi:LytR cell envelope-related transcriptional attenuator